MLTYNPKIKMHKLADRFLTRNCNLKIWGLEDLATAI